MPELSWDEINDWKHFFNDIEIKLHKAGFIKDAAYARSVIDQLNILTSKHAKERK